MAEAFAWRWRYTWPGTDRDPGPWFLEDVRSRCPEKLRGGVVEVQDLVPVEGGNAARTHEDKQWLKHVLSEGERPEDGVMTLYGVSIDDMDVEELRLAARWMARNADMIATTKRYPVVKKDA